MTNKKLRLYMDAVCFGGLIVFLLSLWTVIPYFSQTSPAALAAYCMMMVLLMVGCRMLPIYFAEDKTLEISFVPVLACVITSSPQLAVVLFGVSTLFTVMQNPASKRYYSPLFKEPRKELFNTGNIVLSIAAGGAALMLFPPKSLASLAALGMF